MEKVTISEADKASPYYKYYEREMAAVPAEKNKLLEEPMDSSKALKLTDINQLLEDGYLPGEYGYCRLEDDTLMIANCTQMSGCTVEMVDWWFAWHRVEPMRYIIWNPEEHHYYCKTRNMEQALDQSLSMKERYWGTVHDVTEDMGGGAMAYGTTKSAVNMLTKQLATELAVYGITVNAICPTVIKTPMMAERMTESFEEKMKAKIPLGRVGEPFDCVGPCILYASRAGAFLTGQTTAIDGGLAIL